VGASWGSPSLRGREAEGRPRRRQRLEMRPQESEREKKQRPAAWKTVAGVLRV